MKYIKSIFEIIDDYDCIFCDVNGVITNGISLIYDSRRVLLEIFKMNKDVIFISNATRTENMIREALIKKGLPEYLLDKIITSGDVLRQSITEKANEFIDIDKKNNFLVIGNKNFLNDTSGIKIVNSLSEADYVLLNGITSEIKIKERSFYKEALKRNIPFICTNPDKVALMGDSFKIFHDYTAIRYMNYGGKVYYYGKPHRIMYDTAFKKYNVRRRDRVLCIGDTIVTDIKGADNYDLDSLLVGVYKKIKCDGGSMSDLFARYGVAPTYYSEKMN